MKYNYRFNQYFFTLLFGITIFAVAVPMALADDTTNPISLKHDHSDRVYKRDSTVKHGEDTLSKEELMELKKSKGPSYKGESADFNTYLNSEKRRIKDDDISLLDLDHPNQKVVLGADGAPAGVSFKMDFENSPLE